MEFFWVYSFLSLCFLAYDLAPALLGGDLHCILLVLDTFFFPCEVGTGLMLYHGCRRGRKAMGSGGSGVLPG